MSFTIFPFTPPPCHVSTFLKKVAAFSTQQSLLNMRTPHLSWKPCTLDGDGLGGQNTDVFEFKKVEVGVVVRYRQFVRASIA
jgi:hypothetical protein